ncbi:hypothetical protein EJ08DRAFT_666289 [Tothia fuscella]|uniref:Uncharacterized protein n=1 Tax=Tothia fuscella TaxID=1048955 RepID=A0A9P4TSZ2_9PEZI|nr:hypothetical protein EJ08DRAFT_666289 [Tothia fuscella]
MSFPEERVILERSRQVENGETENASAKQNHFNAYDPPVGMLRSRPTPAPSPPASLSHRDGKHVVSGVKGYVGMRRLLLPSNEPVATYVEMSFLAFFLSFRFSMDSIGSHWPQFFITIVGAPSLAMASMSNPAERVILEFGGSCCHQKNRWRFLPGLMLRWNLSSRTYSSLSTDGAHTPHHQHQQPPLSRTSTASCDGNGVSFEDKDGYTLGTGCRRSSGLGPSMLDSASASASTTYLSSVESMEFDMDTEASPSTSRSSRKRSSSSDTPSKEDGV